MKDISGYEELYAITSCGKVWSYRSKKFLKPFKTRDGYLLVALCKNGIQKNYLVHRLVAEAYLPNPENKPEVDHIDRDKNHNYLNNLRWTTKSENQINTNKVKPIVCLETGEIFKSQHEAARKLGLYQQNIYSVLKGKYKTTGGLHFKYLEEVKGDE